MSKSLLTELLGKTVSVKLEGGYSVRGLLCGINPKPPLLVLETRQGWCIVRGNFIRILEVNGV